MSFLNSPPAHLALHPSPSHPPSDLMIWTLGDFNSVYLLTGGGPADLTHILATIGIRYLRLDQVDLAMATIVCAMPLVLPLVRSEEHTSELQSLRHLVCRLLLEKKKN